MNCDSCRKVIPDGSKYCIHCGARQTFTGDFILQQGRGNITYKENNHKKNDPNRESGSQHVRAKQPDGKSFTNTNTSPPSTDEYQETIKQQHISFWKALPVGFGLSLMHRLYLISYTKYIPGDFLALLIFNSFLYGLLFFGVLKLIQYIKSK